MNRFLAQPSNVMNVLDLFWYHIFNRLSINMIDVNSIFKFNMLGIPQTSLSQFNWKLFDRNQICFWNVVQIIISFLWIIIIYVILFQTQLHITRITIKMFDIIKSKAFLCEIWSIKGWNYHQNGVWKLIWSSLLANSTWRQVSLQMSLMSFYVHKEYYSFIYSSMCYSVLFFIAWDKYVFGNTIPGLYKWRNWF